MDIRVDVKNEGKNYTVTIVGYLDYSNSDVFDTKVKEILKDAESMVIDMENLEYISSAGIRVIVYAYNELENKGGLKLIKLNDVVKEIFEVTGLDSIIEKN